MTRKTSKSGKKRAGNGTVGLEPTGSTTKEWNRKAWEKKRKRKSRGENDKRRKAAERLRYILSDKAAPSKLMESTSQDGCEKWFQRKGVDIGWSYVAADGGKRPTWPRFRGKQFPHRPAARVVVGDRLLQEKRRLWEKDPEVVCMLQEEKDTYEADLEWYNVGVETGVSECYLNKPPPPDFDGLFLHDLRRAEKKAVGEKRRRLSVALRAGRTYVWCMRRLIEDLGSDTTILDPVHTKGWSPEDFEGAEVAPIDGGDRVRITFGSRKKSYIFDVTPRGPRADRARGILDGWILIQVGMLVKDVSLPRYFSDNRDFVTTRAMARTAGHIYAGPASALSQASDEIRGDGDFVARLLKRLMNERSHNEARHCQSFEWYGAHDDLRNNARYALRLINHHGVDQHLVVDDCLPAAARFLRRYIAMTTLGLCVRKVYRRWVRKTAKIVELCDWLVDNREWIEDPEESETWWSKSPRNDYVVAISIAETLGVDLPDIPSSSWASEGWEILTYVRNQYYLGNIKPPSSVRAWTVSRNIVDFL